MSSKSSSSSIDCDPYDIEEELESYFVRKKATTNDNYQSRQSPATSSKAKAIPGSINDHVPLLICDILKLDQKQLEGKPDVFYFNSVPFKGCLLYARVVGGMRETDTFYNYVIDDGTATIEMSVFRQRKNYEELLRLENEIKSYKVSAAAKNKKEISSCLLRMLAVTKEQINFSNILPGNKILAYGKPTVFRGQIGFTAFSLLTNEKLCSSLEIEFKDFLIDWYTQKMICN